jgi:RpiR family carbohydrate utilization transcriptional regulator
VEHKLLQSCGMSNSQRNVLQVIAWKLPHLNPALKRIGVYVLENPETVKLQKIKFLASNCRVSEATVTRFVKEIEFDNFQSFKIALAEIAQEETAADPLLRPAVYDDVSPADSIEDIIHKITFSNIETLQQTSQVIPQDLIVRAVEAIEKANSISIYCAGASTVCGQSALLRFYRLGKKCWMYSDAIQQAVSASLLTENDLAIGISSSGSTRCIVNALRTAKVSGAVTLCLTDTPASPIVTHSDIKFFTSAKHSSFLQDSMVSRMAQLLVIDILYASFAARYFNTSIKSIETSAIAVRGTKL